MSGRGLALSSSTLLGKLVRWPLRLIPRDLAVPIVSGPLRGRRWVVGSGTHGYWLGSYEREKIELFRGEMRSGAVVYDVGANVGYYTLLAASSIGSAGRVVAFEPLPRNKQYLSRHVAANGLTNVTLFPAAVSSHPGEMRFDPGAGPFQGRLAATGELTVEVVVLDDLVDAGRIPPPGVMKIDVEGAEEDVLKGARKILSAHRPTLFLATHGPELHTRCCHLLREAGYDLASVDGHPIEETDEIVARPMAAAGP